MIKNIFCLLILLVFLDGLNAQSFPEITGWKMKENERIYNANDLWELIDGAADIFLNYYFEDLRTAEYSRKGQVIRVEIYRHKTNEDAYGIYATERMPDYPQVKMGTQGYKSTGVLNFLAGNYYVKIMSAGNETADEQSISMIAAKIDSYLNQTKEFPVTLNLFPEEDRIFLSDAYTAQNFLGYSFFHHAFSVKYNHPSGFQLFIIKLTENEIKKMTDQYIALMKEEKVKHEDNYLIIQDLFNGTIILRQKGDYLVGGINTADTEKAKELINKVISKI